MKLFISWSKGESRAFAEALAAWLPEVQQEIEPYISTEIDAGVNWIRNLKDALESSEFGIMCVTKENMNNAWLNFEAGALSVALHDERVAPILIGMKTSDIAPGWPLNHYQAVTDEEGGIYRLVKTINQCCARVLPEAKLEKAFERCWPDFEGLLEQRRALLKPETEVGEGLIGMKAFVQEESLLEDGDQVLLFSNNMHYDMKHFGEVIRDNLNKGVSYLYLIEDNPVARNDWDKFVDYLQKLGASRLPECRLSAVSPRMWTTAIYDKLPPHATSAISVLEYTDDSEECVRYTAHTANTMKANFLNLWDKAIPVK